ncbi:MAG: hypothetical protein P8182_09775 [Deltaproteobacteria bacterium]
MENRTGYAREGLLSILRRDHAKHGLIPDRDQAGNGSRGRGRSFEAWKKYKRKEIVTDSFIGDDFPEIETTTTTIAKGDRSTSVTYEKVVRGRVYPRNGYAVAYVDDNRFFLKAGKVLFNGTPCGSYDRRGMGDINNKPIRIMKVPQKSYYLLVELR